MSALGGGRSNRDSPLLLGDEERAKKVQQMLQETGVLKTTIRKVNILSRNYEIQIKVGQIATAGPI